MAATLDLAPHITASQLNVILGKTVANMTLADLLKLQDALNRIAGANNDTDATIASVIP